MTLGLPPLRERPRDIELLADHFLRKYSDANGVPPRPFAPATLRKLHEHGWPGNVRELENTIHRAVLLADGPEIGVEAILLTSKLHARTNGAEATGGSEAGAGNGEEAAEARGKLVGRTVAAVERDLILETLDHCLGNRTHAAHILGISIRTLRNKLKQYGEQGIRVPMPGGFDRAVV